MMKKRHLVEYTFDLDDILEALRAQHPGIREDSKAPFRFRPGSGPGSSKNSKGVTTYSTLMVTTEVPDPKDSP